MDDTETIEIQHVAPLQADDIPDANQSHQCFSCGEDISGVYCHACGNKNDNYRRSIWSLGAELFASLTAFEGRIWRSLSSLVFSDLIITLWVYCYVADSINCIWHSTKFKFGTQGRCCWPILRTSNLLPKTEKQNQTNSHRQINL